LASGSCEENFIIALKRRRVCEEKVKSRGVAIFTIRAPETLQVAEKDSLRVQIPLAFEG
jgi:hypothetical protein